MLLLSCCRCPVARHSVSPAALLCCGVGKQRLPQTQPTPSRSHPSLVQQKLVVASDKSRKKIPAQEKPRSAGSSRTTGTKPNIPVTARTRSKPDVSTSSVKRTEVAAKSKSKPASASKSEGTAKRSVGGGKVDPLLSSPRSRRRQLADENVDVTTYLLHRMLGAPAQLPDDVTRQLVTKTGNDADDKHSEAGTYTIDDEEDDAVKHSVQQARERIDDVFGVGDRTEDKTADASGHLVRPVIESERRRQDHGGPVGVDADEGVFADTDDAQRQHYVRTAPIDVHFSMTLWLFRHQAYM